MAGAMIEVAAEDLRELVMQLERSISPYDEEVTAAGVNAFRRIRAVLLREGVYPESAHLRSMMRPPNFEQLPTAEQWQIDRALGLLDWDGTDDRVPAEPTEPMNLDAQVSPIFQGVHADRYETNPAELDAARLWEVENTQVTSLGREAGAMLNVWNQAFSLLGRLLSRDPERGINPSPRDWLVASTVVQWLGTLRGRTFLAQLQVASSLRREE